MNAHTVAWKQHCTIASDIQMQDPSHVSRCAWITSFCVWSCRPSISNVISKWLNDTIMTGQCKLWCCICRITSNKFETVSIICTHWLQFYWRWCCKPAVKTKTALTWRNQLSKWQINITVPQKTKHNTNMLHACSCMSASLCHDVLRFRK